MIQSIKSMKDGDNVKLVLGLIFGLAADAAVTAALGGMMPAGRGLKRILRMGGAFILGMMTGEKVEEYVYKVIDETKEIFKEAKENANDIPVEGTVK